MSDTPHESRPSVPDDDAPYVDKSDEFQADPDRQPVHLVKPEKSLRVILLFFVSALLILGILAFIASRIL